MDCPLFSLLELFSLKLFVFSEFQEERSKVDDLRGTPMSVGNLEEIIDDNHAIVSASVGSEYYVSILSFVDKDQLEPGCTVLLNHKVGPWPCEITCVATVKVSPSTFIPDCANRRVDFLQCKFMYGEPIDCDLVRILVILQGCCQHIVTFTFFLSCTCISYFSLIVFYHCVCDYFCPVK